jgi:hypothetical protein
MRHISSFEELDGVMSELHDCPFDLDDANFDEKVATWTGRFYRPVSEDPSAIERTKSRRVFSRYKMPVVLASVCISGVQQVRLLDDPRIGWYTLNRIKRTSNGIRVEFCEALKIDLDLTGPIDVTYVEDPLPGKCAVYRTFLSIWTGPRIEDVASD